MPSFNPTYLYIKRHKDTGLKYFGKTAKKNPYEYAGSGKYWLKHLKKHSNNVENVWVEYFTDKDNCVEFAEFFSQFYNIVNSDDWANLIVENGLDGRSPYNMPEFHKQSLREVRKKQQMKPFSDDRKKHHSELMKTLIHEGKIDYSTRRTNSEKMKGRKSNLPPATCPHCNKTGVLGAMHRWHFDKCKDKK